jgi:hypothetical protein
MHTFRQSPVEWTMIWPVNIPRVSGYAMQLRQRLFVHRYSPKGEIESICFVCLMTVGHSFTAEQMGRIEAEHECQTGSSLRPGFENDKRANPNH